LARWFLAHDEFIAVDIGELVGGIGLAIAELLDLDRSFDLGDVGGDVRVEGGNVNWLPNGASHVGDLRGLNCETEVMRAGVVELEISEHSA
jgi:hypothetical protein